MPELHIYVLGLVLFTGVPVQSAPLSNTDAMTLSSTPYDRTPYARYTIYVNAYENLRRAASRANCGKMVSELDNGSQDWNHTTQQALQRDIDHIINLRIDWSWITEWDFRRNVKLMAWKTASSDERKDLERLWRSPAFIKISQKQATIDLLKELTETKGETLGLEANTNRVIPLALIMLKQQLTLTGHEIVFHEALKRFNSQLAQQWQLVKAYEQHSAADARWLISLQDQIFNNFPHIMDRIRWTDTILKPFQAESRELLSQPMYLNLQAAEQSYHYSFLEFSEFTEQCQSAENQRPPIPGDLGNLKNLSSRCALLYGIRDPKAYEKFDKTTPEQMVPNSAKLICKP